MMDFETWWEQNRFEGRANAKEYAKFVWQAGQAAEREAIYKIVESYFEEDNLNRQWNNACDAIATAIRARGEQ